MGRAHRLAFPLYRDAGVLLTPPFNTTGKYLQALRLTKKGGRTRITERQKALSACHGGGRWRAGLTIAGLISARRGLWELGERIKGALHRSAIVDGQLPLERLRVDGPAPNASSASKPSSFGRSAVAGGADEGKEGAGDEVDDVVGNAVGAEVMRYQALFCYAGERGTPTFSTESVANLTGKRID